MSGNVLGWLEMAGDGQKGRKIARNRPEMAGDDRKCPGMAGNIRECPGIAGNVRRWLEMAGDVRGDRGRRGPIQRLSAKRVIALRFLKYQLQKFSLTEWTVF